MGEILIKGGYGGCITVEKGQLLEILNVEGQQICDFFAFNTDDLSEALSPAHIRSELRRVVLRVGDVLVSRYRNPMFEIMEDTCGRHDIVIPPCDPIRYEQRFGLKGHRSVGGVRVSLYNAVEPAWGDTLAGFMKDFVKSAG